MEKQLNQNLVNQQPVPNNQDFLNPLINNSIPNQNLPGNIPYTNLATLAAAAASTVNPLHYQLLLAQLQQAQITQEQNIYNSNFQGSHSGVGNVQAANNNNSTTNGPNQNNMTPIQPYTTPYVQQNNNQ